MPKHFNKGDTMRSFNQNIEDVLSYFKSGFNGLTSLEASERLQRYGKNRLSEAKKESTIKRFFKQLTEPMTIILLIAAAISDSLLMLLLFLLLL